jgi:hypothetical protein
MDAAWDVVVSLWKWVKLVYQWIMAGLFVLLVIGLILFIPYFIWDLAVHPATRHTAGQGVLRNLKWYILWGAASWLISKIWRKPKETPSAEQPDIQSSKPKSRRKNNRRVQRGR